MDKGQLPTIEDLQQMKQEIIEELRQLGSGKEARSDIEQKWLKTKDVVQYLQISTSQLHNLRARGILKPKKLGGTLYYSKAEIDKVIENGEL